MKKEFLLFFVIFLEGYVVLSGELIAMRQIVPFVGSGTDTVSIIIAAILMPLALGYYAGGQYKKGHWNENYRSIRSKLLKNIFIATLFLVPGLSYLTIALFFDMLANAGIDNRLITTTIYACVFLVIPVFLLAQTIPLISNYFKKEELSRITGKMLSFSTIGSFMGAVFSTLFLMATIGVFNTTIITLLCLVLLFITLSKKTFSEPAFFMMLLALFSILINSPYVMRAMGILEANRHHTVRIIEHDGNRILSLNNNMSSGYDIKPQTRAEDRINAFEYIEYITDTYIEPIQNQGDPKNILIIGAGGFTLGLNDLKNNYTYVDIDSHLQDITEQHFLKRPLADNKQFIPLPARGFLSQSQKNDKQFDLIVLDAYQGNHSIPEHLITVEFFSVIKNSLKENGIVVMNLITSPTFNNKFSIKLDNSLRQVFPLISRQIISPHNGWSKDTKNDEVNIIYIYHHKKPYDGVYSDNKNSSFADR